MTTLKRWARCHARTLRKSCMREYRSSQRMLHHHFHAPATIPTQRATGQANGRPTPVNGERAVRAFSTRCANDVVVPCDLPFIEHLHLVHDRRQQLLIPHVWPTERRPSAPHSVEHRPNEG